MGEPDRKVGSDHPGQRSTAGEVFATALRLGLTSFGGPVAHLGYFRKEYVERKGWISDGEYADLVAMCQFLPGPASSQVGFAIGLRRGGLAGGFASWLGFTLPSALLMLGFALGVGRVADLAHSGALVGLKIAAVAVVAEAVWNMARSLCPDRERASLAIVAAAAVLLLPSAVTQVLVIVGGGIVGRLMFTAGDPVSVERVAPSARGALAPLGLFFALLLLLPLIAATTESAWIDHVDGFYRAGSLVFGGGHVVLPLLESQVVGSGWVDRDVFMAGYGAAQALPGPLFTFSAYLGTSIDASGSLVLGVVCLVAVFVPSWLLVLGAMPLWDSLRTRPWAQAALKGTNAAVVGLLVAALYDPVWTAGVTGPREFVLALVCFGSLVLWKTPPWLVVALAALLGHFWLG